MGPEVLAEHTNVLETIDSVCEQQDEVLKKLQREQLSLERQLQEGGTYCITLGSPSGTG